MTCIFGRVALGARDWEMGAMHRWKSLVLLASFTLMVTACGNVASESSVATNSHIIVTKFTGTLHVSASKSSKIVDARDVPQQVDNAFYLSKSVVYASQEEGSGSSILQSADGGKSWKFLSSVPGIASGMDFVDTDSGYLLSRPSNGGPNNAIYSTTDGGKTWTMVYSGSAIAFRFVTSRTGFAMLQAPITAATSSMASSGIYRTSDGGKTWSPVKATLNIYAVAGSFSFTSPSEGWLLVGTQPSAGSENKYLYKTTDGGLSWSLRAQARFSVNQSNVTSGVLPATGYVTQLQFTSPTQGYMALTRSGLYATDDGGSTWNLMSESPLSAHDLRNVVNFSAWGTSDLSVVTTNSHFYQTSSSGQMVGVYPPYEAQRVFSGPNGLYVVSHAQVISLVHSANSVQTLGYAPSGVVELDPLKGGIIALGTGGLFRSSTGATWTNVPLPKGWTLLQGRFVNSNLGYVVATNNGPPGSAVLDLTTDGGRDWTKISTPFRPFAVNPVSKDDLWALGGTEPSASGSRKKGTSINSWNLYFSKDAGKSWNEFIANWKSVGMLYFLNTQEGYVADGKYLFHTTDGGRSFVRYMLPLPLTGADQFSMTFGTNGSGWALANSSYPIFYTSDGGGTWRLNP